MPSTNQILIAEEIEHLTKLRDRASSEMHASSSEELRVFLDGKRGAYEVALSSLARLKKSIGKGGNTNER